MALPSRFTIMTMMIVMTILITYKERLVVTFMMTFVQILMTLMTLPCQVCPTNPNARQAALDESLGCLQVSRFVHTTHTQHKHPHAQRSIHTNTHTCTVYQQTYTKKLGCPHQYELLWPKPSIVFIARNTVRILSHKLYPSKHEECLCLWLLAQSHNTLLWALTLDWKNEKAAKCQKTKCVFCSDPFLARPFPLPPPDSLWQVHFSGEIDPSFSLSFTPFQLWLLPLPTQKIHFHFSANVFFYQFHCFHILMLYFMGEIDPSRSFSTVTFDSPTLKHQFHISIKMHLFLFHEF